MVGGGGGCKVIFAQNPTGCIEVRLGFWNLRDFCGSYIIFTFPRSDSASVIILMSTTGYENVANSKSEQTSIVYILLFVNNNACKMSYDF